jgi:hypothetical protein
MFFLFKLYGNFSMDTSEEISAQGNWLINHDSRQLEWTSSAGAA